VRDWRRWIVCRTSSPPEKELRFLMAAPGAPCAEFLFCPKPHPVAIPSWFGFPLTLKPAAGCNRVDLLTYLDQYRIGTRCSSPAT
jgi:hypothetical protein